MNSPASARFDRDFVRPLREAENEFLQVLLTSFRLKAKGHGLELRVEFKSDSPAIWRRVAKDYILEELSLEKRLGYQAKFDELLLLGNADFTQSDPDFPFRFGNGGTLPVVRIGGTDHYCLFFRDTHPVGWNIANGGANNVYDLLHPDAIIERELREELIVLEPERGRRYIFDWHNAKLHDHPDFGLANFLWMERFRRRGYSEFTEVPLPLKWIPPHDLAESISSSGPYDSVQVIFDSREDVHTGHGLLNINADDFGIEFDRIAKLSVSPGAVRRDAVFCDGEIVDGRLLNRVVGLFKVEKLNAALKVGATEFQPDLLFWDGTDRTGEDTASVVRESLAARERDWPEPGSCGVGNKTSIQLELCPVTRNLIRRFLRLTERELPSSGQTENRGPFDVFISFGSEDQEIADQVYHHLSHDKNRRVFFSDVAMNHGPFSQQIDQALDTAWALVAVGSRVEHLRKSWVQYEWESFHNDILSGRKSSNAQLVPFVIGIDPNDLPRPLRRQQVVQAERSHMEQALQKLADYVRKP